MRGFWSVVKSAMLMAAALSVFYFLPAFSATQAPMSAPPTPVFAVAENINLKKPYFLTLDTIVLIDCMNIPPELLKRDPKTLTQADFANVKHVSGSGTIISHNRVLTVHHVLAGMSVCRIGNVTFHPKTDSTYDSANLDLAVVQVALGATAVTDISCDGFMEGQSYFAFGYAEGQDFAMDALLSAGYEDVPSKGDDGKPTTSMHMGVFSGGLTPGMSGGPVIGMDGRVVGVNNITIESVNTPASASRSLSDSELCSALKPIAVIAPETTAAATPSSEAQEAVTQATK